MRLKPRDVVVVLDNIRSVYNAGSIFRTAEGAGVAGIYCTGMTPRPNDRFGLKRPDFSKVALGAEDMVPWKYFKSTVVAIKKLKEKDFQIVVLEQSPKSVDYRKVKTEKKTALVIGNEVNGVKQRILNLADVIVEIPMKGKKESLNAAVAAGIALFQICR